MTLKHLKQLNNSLFYFLKIGKIMIKNNRKIANTSQTVKFIYNYFSDNYFK